MEDRASSGGELLFAGRLKALVKLCAFVFRLRFPRDTRDFVAAAYDAAHAIGPAAIFEICQALLICRECSANFYEFHGLPPKIDVRGSENQQHKQNPVANS